MEWTSDLEIGVEEIDADHRQLFALVGELLAAIAARRREVVGPSIEFLQRYAREHFAREQQLMAAAGYPRADAHAAEHASFASDLAALAAERRARPDSPWIGSKLGVWIAGWARDHVAGEDRELGRFLAGQRRDVRVGTSGSART